MSVVHEDDAYGRLMGLCVRLNYSLEIATLRKGMSMRIIGPGRDAQISTPFTPGKENSAAAVLLRKLRQPA